MIQTKKSLNRFLLMSAVFISSLLSGCENSVAQDDSPLQISFKNSSSSSLQNLLVGDIVIGDLAPENISKRYGFTSFTFDTGMPDEDASAFIGGKLYTNHHRGYWCGTEKITISEGIYLIEIEVIDTVLFLSCQNAPTIFDR